MDSCGPSSRRTRALPPWARRRCKRSSTWSTLSAMTCPGSHECACRRAWTRSTCTGRRRRRRLWPRSSRISKPWPGAPMTCGNGTRNGRAPLPGGGCMATAPPTGGPRPVPCHGGGLARRFGPVAPPVRDSSGGAAGCPQEQQAQVHQGLLAGQALGARLKPNVVPAKLFQCSRLSGRNKKSSKFIYPPTKPTRTWWQNMLFASLGGPRWYAHICCPARCHVKKTSFSKTVFVRTPLEHR